MLELSTSEHVGWAALWLGCRAECLCLAFVQRLAASWLLRVFAHLWEHTVQGLLVLLYLQKIPLQALEVEAPVPRPPTVPFLALEHVSHRLRMQTGSNNRMSTHTAPT